jgi:hypothetical protein
MKGADRNPERPAPTRQSILTVIVCCAVAACAGGSAPLNTDLDRKDWLHCARDRDCAPMFLSCHGWDAARADRHAQILGWYLRENDRALSVRDCPGRADVPRPQTVCRVNRCEAIPPSTP